MKGQSALEFMSVYSWALIILAIFISIVIILSVAQRSAVYPPSYCYIEPELPCYQMLVMPFKGGSYAVLLLSNNLGTAINLQGNSIAINPTYATVTYYGSCTPANVIQGSAIFCNATLNNYYASLGTQLNPKFTLSYKICGQACKGLSKLELYNTTGYATLTVSPFFLYFKSFREIATPSTAGTLLPGNGTYPYGTRITISEAPKPGYYFGGWTCTGTGCYSGTATQTTITILSNITETATFGSVPELFTESALPSNGGTVSPGSGTYAYGTQLQISATPAAGYQFTGWTCTGTGCYSGNSQTATIVMNNAITETANFAPINVQLTMLASPSNGGTVSPGSGTYNYGSNVAISTAPLTGYQFTGWSCTGNGCYSGASNTATITINNNITETANFASLPPTTCGTLPSGIIHCIQLTITNNQTSSIPAGAQILVPFRASSYQSYLSSNLTNVEFYYKNGTIISSWMEGSALNEQQTSNLYTSSNVLYWIKSTAINGTIGPGLGQWVSTTPFPITNGYQSCVTYNGYIYCVYGVFASSNPASVYYAPLSSSGVGLWSSTTSYPKTLNLGGTSCVTSNGYIYCVGGQTNSDPFPLPSYYAPLSSSGVGSWTQTTTYPIGTRFNMCAAYNGYIYCAGGPDGGTKSVYYAPLSSSGIGSWSSTTSYPFTMTHAGCATYNGNIYCVAGTDTGTSTASNSVYYATVSSSGVGLWSSTTPFPANVDYPQCVTYNGYIYCPTANNNAVSYYAPLYSNGVGGWNSTTTPGSGYFTEACVAYNSYMYCLPSGSADLYAHISVPTNGIQIVYMGFASNTVNLFDGSKVGEAPQLTAPYAKYDDGANIFDTYDNFAGASLNSRWSTITSGATISVNNGVTVTVCCGGVGGGIYINSNIGLNEVAEAQEITTTTQGGMFVYAQSGLNGFGVAFSPSGHAYTLSPQLTGGQQSEGSYNSWSSQPQVGGIGSNGGQEAFVIGNYGAGTFTDTSSGTMPNFNSGVYPALGYNNFASSGTVSAQWFRERRYPPNGVMPSVAFGPFQ